MQQLPLYLQHTVAAISNGWPVLALGFAGVALIWTEALRTY